MRVRFMSLFLSCVAALTLALAAQTTPAQTMLEAARKQKVVDGDVKGAIQQYQVIVDRYGKTERAVAAQALLAMAQTCAGTKSGARIVAEFADQTAAASEARTRLQAAAPASPPSQTQVWTGVDSNVLPPMTEARRRQTGVG